MTIPIIYVFSSTKGEYVNGEQRDTELYTVAVTADGTELFRTHGTLDPMRLDVRVEDHAALHSALRTYAPDGYEVQWHAPPEADVLEAFNEPTSAPVEPVAALEPVAAPVAAEDAVAAPVAPVADGGAVVPPVEPVAPVKHDAVGDIIHHIEDELKTLTEGL